METVHVLKEISSDSDSDENKVSNVENFCTIVTKRLSLFVANAVFSFLKSGKVCLSWHN